MCGVKTHLFWNLIMLESYIRYEKPYSPYEKQTNVKIITVCFGNAMTQTRGWIKPCHSDRDWDGKSSSLCCYNHRWSTEGDRGQWLLMLLRHLCVLTLIYCVWHLYLWLTLILTITQTFSTFLSVICVFI